MEISTAPKTVSVVILTWNRKDDLRVTLEKLRGDSYAPLEVIVVDNASTDGTGAMVRADFPEVVYLPQEGNIGIAGYNAGFRAARGEYIVALDSDSYPAPGAIARMADLFGHYPDAGIVAFDVYSSRGEGHPVPQFDGTASDVPGYHGAGAGIRRAVFDKVGYWYEPFFLYFNEMDHSIRTLAAGWRIIHSPAVRAYHKSSVTARPSERGAFYYTRNAFWLVWRHYPAPRMLRETAFLIYHSISEGVDQKTFVYARAAASAFAGAWGVWRSRRPAPAEVLLKIRAPLKLVFTRFG